MDGNKDEALRCIRVAEEAIATGNKERALKFIKIALRLNNNLPVDELLTMCERLGSESSTPSRDENVDHQVKREHGSRRSDDGLNGERNYTEHVQLIREIKGKNDYYAILGVEKTCSVDDIRRAYRKLSLKVHPDKNKSPGSEEAFKKVSEAFRCLSDDGSRRQYDQTGLVEEFEYNQRHNVRRRRRRTTTHDFFNDDIDPDEIFRAFFGEAGVFGRGHVYQTRGTGGHQRQEFQGGGLNVMLLLQLVPFLIVFLLAYLPFSEPDYSLHKNHSYYIPKTTEKYGIGFFVKSESFEAKYPHGSPARVNIEVSVIHDHKNLLRRYCQIELQRRSWNRNLPTPYCEKLQKLGVVA